MKIIYVNCGVKNEMKDDPRSYIRNFCSCEKKVWKKKVKGSNPVQAWIFYHFSFVLFLYFFDHFSCRKDLFTVLSLKFSDLQCTSRYECDHFKGEWARSLLL